MKKMLEKATCFTILIGLVSCWSGSDKISDEISGTYAFEFPSGEYQILKINSDSSYSQNYYSDYNNFKKHKEPIYSNIGRWAKTSKFQIHLDNYLEICYMSNPDSILPKPEYFGQGNVNWYKASSENKSMLSIYDENNYIFEKID